MEWLIDAYEKEISKTDAYLGELLDALPEEVRARTVVAFTADHGESLTEHDYLFDHGDFLYDASLRIPLVLSGPGLPRGERVSCQVSGIDVAPTLRALAKLPALAQHPFSWDGALATLNVAHQFYTWTRTVKNHSKGSASLPSRSSPTGNATCPMKSELT